LTGTPRRLIDGARLAWLHKVVAQDATPMDRS
jgi:hypothetical protein